MHRVQDFRVLRAHSVAVIAADEVHASFEDCGNSLFGSGRKMVAAKDVGDRTAIGDYIAVKTPILTEMLLQEIGIGASWLAVQGVVRAHHGFGLALHDRGAKCG